MLHIWEYDKTGEKKGLVCLECRAQGKPWINTTCEHIRNTSEGTILQGATSLESADRR
jgi:hypothetical protein